MLTTTRSRIRPVNGGRPRILVIDDDEDVCVVLDELLTDEGYEVVAFQDPIAALGVAIERMPALILLDLLMPLMDGSTFVARYRSRARPAAPIVVLTGALTGEDEARRIGAQGFIGKPFDLEQVVRQIDRCLAAT